MDYWLSHSIVQGSMLLGVAHVKLIRNGANAREGGATARISTTLSLFHQWHSMIRSDETLKRTEAKPISGAKDEMHDGGGYWRKR